MLCYVAAFLSFCDVSSLCLYLGGNSLLPRIYALDMSSLDLLQSLSERAQSQVLFDSCLVKSALL